MSIMPTARAGFTLIEIVVVIGILALIALFSVGEIRDYAATQQLQVAEQELVSLVRETRQRTLAAETHSQFGLRFASSSVTRFEGAAYADEPDSHTEQTFPGVTFVSPLIDSDTDVVYSRLTGTPSATGTISIIHGQTGLVRELRLTDAGLLVSE